jgi:hypothetical protein
MTTKQPIAQRLHDDMHKLPGVPAHEDAAAHNTNEHANARARGHAAKLRSPRPAPKNGAAHHGNPRVLVGWQRRIGRLFGHDSH